MPTCAAISYQSGQAHLSTRITDGLNTDQPVSYNDGVPRNYGESSSEPMASVPQLALPAFEDVALLKVDVEGFEPCVFYGARDLIRASRPVILFERNWKFMDPEVQSTLGIPDEVAGFSVEESPPKSATAQWCRSTTRPATCSRLRPSLPDRNRRGMACQRRWWLGGDSARCRQRRRGCDRRTRSVLVITVGPSTVVLLLALQVPTLVYNGTYVYGEVEGNTIYWANSTQWDR